MCIINFTSIARFHHGSYLEDENSHQINPHRKIHEVYKFHMHYEVSMKILTNEGNLISLNFTLDKHYQFKIHDIGTIIYLSILEYS
jgi:hypothetical protein